MASLFLNVQHWDWHIRWPKSDRFSTGYDSDKLIHQSKRICAPNKRIPSEQTTIKYPARWFSNYVFTSGKLIMARLIAVHYISHSRLIDVYRAALEINQEAFCAWIDIFFVEKARFQRWNTQKRLCWNMIAHYGYLKRGGDVLISRSDGFFVLLNSSRSVINWTRSDRPDDLIWVRATHGMGV